MRKIHFIIILLFLPIFSLYADNENLYLTIGNETYKEWQGTGKNGNGIIRLQTGESAFYRHPDGKRYPKGFRVYNEGCYDWSRYKGIRMNVRLTDNKPVEFYFAYRTPESQRINLEAEGKAFVRLQGKGMHTVMLPWNRFNISAAHRTATLMEVKEAEIGVVSGKAEFSHIEAVAGNRISLRTDVYSRPVQPGKQVVYNLEVGNTARIAQSITLNVDGQGWESMKVLLSQEQFDLQPGETTLCQVIVTECGRAPRGSREKHIVRATVNGMPSEGDEIELTTVVALPFPNIVHTSTQWDSIRSYVKQYDWARKAADEYLRLAKKWKVPEYSNHKPDNESFGPHLFATQEEFGLMACGISYQLTENKLYADKIAGFLRKLSDPVRGYPTTFRGCHQSFVQEGHFFQHIAMAYDMIRPSGVITATDEKQIEETFRLYIETVQRDLVKGGINNWKLSEMCGALYCALAIQDWKLVEDMFYRPSAIVDHLAHGLMNDGWWYECSLGYNIWCTSEFSQVAIALEPWGINFKNMKIPIGTTKYYSLMPDYRKGTGRFGMNFDKWGPITKNYVCLKDMWDAIPRFADYRGMVFAINDSAEKSAAGSGYDLAYYLFKDPEYAALVRLSDKRDLLYALPDMPDVPSAYASCSAKADNIGIAMLRSQTPNRPQSEQIQAVLHYGTHGGAHGHFDRASLLHLSRYGRSFFNPEVTWFGYASYMYKYYVQTSVTKNMVVVDGKMQEATESTCPLFYNGKMMQIAMVETNSRWSNPPYGGMVYGNGITDVFKEKAEEEGRSIPYPKKAPQYGEMTGYTEPILQRQLMIITDDYVLLADYLRGTQEHTFDCMYQIKGFQGLEADKKHFLRHDDQMNTDPLGSAQFITNCDWWSATGTSCARFLNDRDTNQEHCEPGILKMDVYTAWPTNKDIMVGSMAVNQNVNKRITYAIKADGKTLNEGKTGAWVLGAVDIDQPLNRVNELVLELSSSPSRNASLFWGDARILLEDGKEVLLSELPMKKQNVKQPQETGCDYQGGPVIISGRPQLHALPANPEDVSQKAVITIDLSGIKAVAFRSRLGSDYPLGDESQHRKTYAIRSVGKEATFLNIIEPYDKDPIVTAVNAVTDNEVEVSLIDGRTQRIHIEGLSIGECSVKMEESKNGKVIRIENYTYPPTSKNK